MNYKINGKSAPWMTKELREMVKLKKRLWFKCRSSRFKQTKMMYEHKILKKI